MTSNAVVETLKNQIVQLLDETFGRVHGIYLDRGTSLYETLESLSAEEASRSIGQLGTSIAAQTEHIRFYLHVIQGYIQGIQQDKIDWRTSWRRNEVTPDEWEEMKANLRAEHDQILILLKNVNDWSLENNLGGALAAIVHTAYHLGAIRQILKVARG